jgi:hypothetical protein
MLKNIVPSRTTIVTCYAREFEWAGQPGSGFTFPCDADGNPDIPDTAVENYALCVALSATGEVLDFGIVDRSYRHTTPASGECVCGRTVWLDYDHGYGCGCDCGRNYNLSGQELAPLSQWEERMDADDHWTVADAHRGHDACDGTPARRYHPSDRDHRKPLYRRCQPCGILLCECEYDHHRYCDDDYYDDY